MTVLRWFAYQNDGTVSTQQNTPKAPTNSVGNEWNEDRLLRLIGDRIEENAELEYKAAAGLKSDQKGKEEITKDVSAMANAAGGTIIYGISEFQDRAQEHLPEKIDPVDRLQFSKEWLEQVVSQIKPRIDGLRVVPVQLASANNHVVYVVEVPKGETAHQALTLRYHRRYNFEVLPMLDHEIRDVMNRRRSPRLVVELTPAVRSSSREVAFTMQAVLINESEAVSAYEVVIALGAPAVNGLDTGLWEFKKSTYEPGNYRSKNPIHPGERQMITKWDIGSAYCPVETLMALAHGQKFDRRLHSADFTGFDFEMEFRLFAQNHSPMSFRCHFSKEEVNGLKPKLFRPV